MEGMFIFRNVKVSCRFALSAEFEVEVEAALTLSS